MPKDYAPSARASRVNKTTQRSSSRKRPAKKHPAKKKGGPKASPTQRTFFHGPSFSFGALLGAALVILTAYAPEIAPKLLGETHRQTNDLATAAPQPSQPTVEFQFPELLRNSEVKPDPKPYAVPEPPPEKLNVSYTVQAASFRQQADAQQLRAKLILQDLPATVSQASPAAEGTASTWYRVTVGPFTRQIEAERALTKLREQGMDAIFLRR